MSYISIKRHSRPERQPREYPTQTGSNGTIADKVNLPQMYLKNISLKSLNNF